MHKVLIVDDEKPARDRLRKLLALQKEVEVVGEAADGLEALEKVDSLRPDLLFLDIEMPELNGLEVARSLGLDGPAIIFVTAYDQHALEAFEASAIDYLVKPVVPERLEKAILKSKRATVSSPHETYSQLSTSSKLAVRVGAKFEVFDVRDVSAILARDHYAAIVINGRELFSEDSLETLMTRLSPSFLRVHRGAIINLDFLQELKRHGDRKYSAILKDAVNTEVPISRERLSELKQRLNLN